MSLTMDQIHHIRDLFYQQDKNISQIASETGLNRKTVRKYVDMEDFSSPPPTPASEMGHESKLDPFKPLIDSWLEADKLAPRKQRHTAKRIYRRLLDEAEGFHCSYRLVALYVKEKKEELKPVIVKVVVSKILIFIVYIYIWAAGLYSGLRPAVNDKTSCCSIIDS